MLQVRHATTGYRSEAQDTDVVEMQPKRDRCIGVVTQHLHDMVMSCMYLQRPVTSTNGTGVVVQIMGACASKDTEREQKDHKKQMTKTQQLEEYRTGKSTVGRCKRIWKSGESREAIGRDPPTASVTRRRLPLLPLLICSSTYINHLFTDDFQQHLIL